MMGCWMKKNKNSGPPGLSSPCQSADIFLSNPFPHSAHGLPRFPVAAFVGFQGLLRLPGSLAAAPAALETLLQVHHPLPLDQLIRQIDDGGLVGMGAGISQIVVA